MVEYYKIFIMFIICVALAIIILGLSYIVKSKNYNWEKTSAYECGFQPFEDTRSRFDVKFYLVAILFIIFDLEIAYLFPWSLCLYELSIEGIISMIIFLFVLTIGFVYEWKKGALDWY
jgi:NADH:ubiquinone oxidoreductase subunit 3 (subunit A)